MAIRGSDQDPDALAGLNHWFIGNSPNLPPNRYIQRHHCYATVSCDAAWVNWEDYDLNTPDGLHIYLAPGTPAYQAGSYAQFIYQAPGQTTRIEWAELLAYYHRRGGSQQPHMFTGTWSSTGAWTSLLAYTQDVNGAFVTHYGNTNEPGLHSVSFGFAASSTVTNGNWRDGYIGGGAIALTDPEDPTISSPAMFRLEPSATPGQPAVWNPRALHRWVRGKDAVAFRSAYADPGLGISVIKLSGPGLDEPIGFGCGGTKAAPCPSSIPASEANQIEFSPENVPEGANTAYLNAWDPLGHHKDVQVPVNVDNTRPTIELSDDLWAGKENPQGSGTPILGVGTHALHIETADAPPPNAPGIATAGVEKIEVKIDGDVVATDQGTCTQDCSRTFDWDLDTADYGGKRTVRVEATDGAGNTGSKVFVVNLPTRGELVLPVDGESTSSRLALQAEAREDDFTGVEFQYREMPTGLWKTIGGGTTLRDDRGDVVVGTSHPLDQPGRRTKKLIWDPRTAIDLAMLTPKPGPFQVRAKFSGNGDHFSKVANVELDSKGLSAGNAHTAVGPGSVDLLTGNFSYGATDAALSGFGQGLTLTRTYNSLDPEVGGMWSPLGSGWVVSSPVEGVSDYSSLVELKGPGIDGWIDVFDSSGMRIRFEQLADDSYRPEPGFESLSLAKAGNDYTLTDLDGTVTTFASLAGSTDPVEFVPSQVRQAGEQGVSRFKYELHAGKPQLTRIIAPAPSGLDCSTAVGQLQRGCKVLELEYGNVVVAGLGEYRRLKRIRHVAWDPATNQMKDEAVAQFSYYESSGDPWGSLGRLKEAWDPRLSPVLKERYFYDSVGRLREIAPPGEASWWLWYKDPGTSDAGKFAWVVRDADGSGQEGWSVNYQMPLTGYGAWFEMGPQVADAIGQTDRPTDGTVVVRNGPGENQYLITGHYLNQDGREVNTARAGMGISTTEYDEFGNVVRELSAENRAKALDAGGSSATAAGLLSTYRTYSSDGVRMLDELGPEHEVKLDSGTVVDARAHSTTAYDEGYTPQSGQRAPNLPTTVTTGAQVEPSDPDVDLRTVKTEYDWTLRKPTRTIVDAVSGGLNVTRQTDYDTYGLETASRQPKSNGSDAGTTKTLYYTADGSSSDAACRNKPEWFNLPCKTKPGAQPGTAGLPDLPVTTYTYNRFGQVLTATEQVGTATRTTTTTYDDAGRQTSDSVTTGGIGNVPNGMVAAYGFDEGSGTTVSDSSGNSNNGTISGASWTSAGKYGGALSFDGVNDSVAVPDANSLDLTTAMTLSAWVKMDAVSNRFQALLYKERNSNDGSYALEADSTVSSRPGLNFRTTGWQAARAPDPLSTNQWAHFAAAWDGTTTKIYLNGTLVKTQTMTGTVVASTGLLKIGGTAITGSNQHVDGLIDEVRLYNRALSQTEVQTDRDTSVAAQTSNGLGAPVPPVTYGYSSTTGRPTTVSTSAAATTTAYDNVGRVTSYTDADGTTSTTSYDRLNRPVTTTDGKGTQTRTYDLTTGALTTLSDSHAGTFTASYDADGRITSKTYPNGMKADTTYDPSGSPVALKYTKTSNCSSNCVWIDEQVKESIHGQWRTHSWELSSQEYTYDKAGRLTRVEDDVQSPAAVAGCTIRSYAFDANSNRTSMNTKAPAGNGDCQPGAAGTSKTYSYDDADRLTGTGIQYDQFGRMTSIPSQHSGGGVLTYTYYANEQVRTIAQDGVSKTYILDPMGRQRQTVASGGMTYTETLHYQDGSDSPSWTRVANAQGVETSWERNIEGIDGDLAAIRTHNAQGDTTVLQLQNLHGDIVATASIDANATALTARFETDEFGNPREQSGRRYGWLGGKQRRAELASGVIQMGVRSYVPALGRFTSVDPVAGGSATAYEYGNADPVNNLDLTGTRAKKKYSHSDTKTVHLKGGGRVIITMNTNLRGNRATATISVTAVGARVTGVSVNCREEHIIDNNCGKKGRGVTRAKKTWKLLDDANYHIEFDVYGAVGKTPFAGYFQSPQFSCRDGREPQRCEFN